MSVGLQTVPPARRVAVVVLGDLGRSLRMLNHARELAGSGWRVDLIGFRETPLPPWVDASIGVRRIPSFESVRARGPVAALLAFALVRQALLGAALGRGLASRFDAILVQAPPSFPALPIALLAARLRGARVVVDWQNTTEAMLRLRLGRGGPIREWIAAACGKLEIRLGRSAEVSLCTTPELVAFLRRGGIEARELPDLACEASVPEEARDGSTIVSPSSWSEDDDFDLFLAAAPRLDALLARRQLRARFVFSGVGERRAWFEAQCAALRLDRIRIETTFVAPADYPRLLRTAAFGLSLHRSAAGLDLPLKIVEMHANGTPVCALDSSPAIRERIRDGELGVLFSSPEEMAARVASLLDPENPLLAAMRRNVAAEPRERWTDAWGRVAKPLFA
jgi:beta-1,4-mannosyltransferase